MAIDALAGTPGSGKSYALTKWGLEALASGKNLHANYGFVHDRVYRWLRFRRKHSHREAMDAVLRIHELRDYQDLVGIHDAVLLLDEAHDWLNARSYALIPHEIIAWWSQHRHAKVDVYMASQRIGSVDAHVRSLLARTRLCRPLPWWIGLVMNVPRRLAGRAPRPYLRLTDIFDESTGELGGSAGNMLASVNRNEFISLDFEIASCYDTHGGVFPSPLHALERATKKRSPEAERLLGELEFEFKKHRARPSPARDGMPCLSMREYAAGASLADRWSAGPADGLDVEQLRAEVERAFPSVSPAVVAELVEHYADSNAW